MTFGQLFRESPSFRLGVYAAIPVVAICLLLAQIIQPVDDTLSFWLLLLFASPVVVALLSGAFALLGTADQDGKQKYIHLVAVCAAAVAATMLIFLTSFRIDH
jgi:hypothetical protein